MNLQARSIVESDQYKRDRDVIFADCKRWDGRTTAVIAMLASNPQEAGRHSGHGPFWYITTEYGSFITPLLIVYTFDENHVCLESVRFGHVDEMN